MYIKFNSNKNIEIMQNLTKLLILYRFANKKSVIEIINTANKSAIPLLPELSSAFSFTSPVILLKNQRLPKITIKAKMVTSKKKSKIYPTDVNIHIFPESRDK